MKDNNLWIFLHPPRTGGGTLLNTLLKRVPKEEILSTSLVRYDLDNPNFDQNKLRFMIGHATYYGIHKLAPNKVPRYFIFLRDPAERIVSHYNAKMIKETKLIPFNEWYKNQIKNEMVHVLDLKFKGSESTTINTPRMFIPLLKKLNYKSFYFLQSLAFRLFGLTKSNKKNDIQKLDNAKKLLNLCWFVSIIEHSDEDIPFLLKEMGLGKAEWEKETLSKKVLILNDELRERIYGENPLDFEIYQYALKLREEKIKEIKKSKKVK